MIGDGINVAQRVMSFAHPNQILVSRSYHEVVSRLSQEYAQLFHYAGLHRDKHVREHEVYEVHLAPSPGGGAAASGPAAVEAAPADRSGPAPRERFDGALLGRLATALAREIGPVATLVVRRAAERADHWEALVAAVGDRVPETARPRVLTGLGDLGGGPRPSSRAKTGGHARGQTPARWPRVPWHPGAQGHRACAPRPGRRAPDPPPRSRRPRAPEARRAARPEPP